MKHITKILFVGITSLSLMFSAQAGELAVNGTAKATYVTTQGQQRDNGIGITNELNFTASGEMDNGFTWNYSMELDPTTTGDTATSPTNTPPGGALNDDTQMSVTMNDFGTIKLCVSECGNNKKYAFDASAYTVASDTGLSEGITYPADEGSYATIQYHTPALPFGTTASIAHGNQKIDGQSGNAQGPASAADSDSATFYSLVTKPVDGLTVSGSYYALNDYANGLTDSAGQKEEGGAYAAKYAYSNITVGYGKSYKANESNGAVNAAGATTVEWVENTGISAAYAVNDDLSISYSDETSEVNYYTGTTAAYDIEMQSLQAAYSLGGATLSIAHTKYENVGYVQGIDMSDNILALTFAF